MIEKTDFPYTLGGYVEQQNYKGFDIAVSIRRYKGISAYVISSEKRLIREESATFADKEDMFRWGREAVDRYLEQQERRKEENAVKRADYYKKKARVAALKAFNAAMYFSDIKDGLYDKVHIYARLQSVADVVGQVCKLIGRNYRQKRADEAEDERNNNGLVPRL